MTCIVPSPLLRAALVVDAAATGSLALIQLLAPHAAARLLGPAVELIIATGVLLLAYAVALMWLAGSATMARTLVRLIVGGNGAWSAGCAVVASVLPTTPLGTAYLLAQSAAVAALGVVQARGLGQSIESTRTNVNLAWRNTL